MTLVELTTSVYSITNRPDLVGQTLLAIQNATLKCHQLDYFWKDIREQGVQFLTAEYLQSFEYQVLFPLWRSLKYIRKSDVTGTMGPFLEIILPETAIDQYHYERTNVVYGAGINLQIKSSTLLQYMVVGYYTNPDITQAGYNSWIAVDHPFAIVNEAAAQIFKQIGKSEEFQTWTLLAREAQQMLINSNVQIQGY